MQLRHIDVIHEPFTDCYYFGSERESSRYGDYSKNANLDRSAIYSEIFRPRSGKFCFIKELAFQALPYVNDAFLKNATHFFLINRPDVVYASLVKIKPDFSQDEFGFSALHTLFNRVEKLQREKPEIYTAIQFRNNPEFILRRFCYVADIPFSYAMLEWKRGPVRLWRSHEQDCQLKWHRSIEQSEGVMPYVKPKQAVTIGADAVKIVENAWKVYSTLANPNTDSKSANNFYKARQT